LKERPKKLEKSYRRNQKRKIMLLEKRQCLPRYWAYMEGDWIGESNSVLSAIE